MKAKQKPKNRSGICSGCGQSALSGQAYCAPCHAGKMREWRKDNPLEGEARRRAIARSYAHVYVKRGRLEKGSCEVCGGNRRIEMHHKDYEKPLSVMWLCRKHHLELHRLEREKAQKEEIRA